MIECIFVFKERRQQGRFAGFSIYVSPDGTRDNSSLCYKDGPKLPALIFTTTCITSGRYVTFYNERLPGVTYPDGYVVDSVYTELCEVTVHGKKNYKSLLVPWRISQLALKLELKCKWRKIDKMIWNIFLIYLYCISLF